MRSATDRVDDFDGGSAELEMSNGDETAMIDRTITESSENAVDGFQAAKAATIAVDWPAPPRVRAIVTTRNGGRSSGPYSGQANSGGLNLGTRCGDRPDDVAENRLLLRAMLPAEPRWLLPV